MLGSIIVQQVLGGIFLGSALFLAYEKKWLLSFLLLIVSLTILVGCYNLINSELSKQATFRKEAHSAIWKRDPNWVVIVSSNGYRMKVLLDQLPPSSTGEYYCRDNQFIPVAPSD